MHEISLEEKRVFNLLTIAGFDKCRCLSAWMLRDCQEDGNGVRN